MKKLEDPSQDQKQKCPLLDSASKCLRPTGVVSVMRFGVDFRQAGNGKRIRRAKSLVGIRPRTVDSEDVVKDFCKDISLETIEN